MVHASSGGAPYRTRFSDGAHEGYADATADKGGAGAGFRPHDLLEAALSSCANMAVRMYAESRGLPLAGVTTRVSLDRGRPEEAVFRTEVELEGELTPDERRQLMRAADVPRTPDALEELEI
jgi:putative redox protein